MTSEDPIQSETLRLVQVISALSDAPDRVSKDGRLLQLKVNGSENLLEAMLKEIDETVLQRYLTFTNDQNRRLIAEVAERRVMRFQLEALGEKTGTNFAKQPYLTSEDAPRFFKCMHAYANSSNAVRVRSGLPGQTGSRPVEGVASHSLRALYQGSKNSCTFDDFEGALLEQTKQMTVAFWVARKNKELLSWGSKNERDALKALYEHDQVAKGSSLVIWSGNLRADCAVARVATPDFVLLAMLREQAIDGFLKLWRSHVAQHP